MTEQQSLPNGELVLRTLAMPADTNANGDIFGGWIMSQMDIGGAILAKRNCLRSRCYCKCNRHYLSKTCCRWRRRLLLCSARCLKPVTLQLLLILKCGLKVATEPVGQRYRATEAVFTYVAVDENNSARRLPEGKTNFTLASTME